MMCQDLIEVLTLFALLIVCASCSLCDDDDSFPPELVSTERELDDSFFQLQPPQLHEPRNLNWVYLYGECNCTKENRTYCDQSFSETDDDERNQERFPALIPATMVDLSLADIARRSTCPYLVMTTHDPDRVPSVIREVKCLCEHCQHSGGRTIHTCQPVKYYRSVWRRTCRPHQRRYHFTKVLEPVTAGCVCVRQTTVPFRQLYHSPSF